MMTIDRSLILTIAASTCLCISVVNAQVAPVKVADLNPDGGSRPYAMKVGGAANDRLYFSTKMDHGAQGYTFGIHSTTGAVGGTTTLNLDDRQVEVAQAGTQGLFYKRYTNSVDYSFHYQPAAILQAPSATPALNFVLAHIPPATLVSTTLFNGKLIHPSKQDPALGYELYSMPQALHATATLIKDMDPGPGSGMNHEIGCGVIGVLHNKVYFSANSVADGRALWSTNGTAAGTIRRSNLPANSSFFSSENKVFGDRLFMSVAEGPTNEELFAILDSTSMLVKIKEINPSPNAGSAPREFTALGKLLFFTADDGTKGRELWRTDGTAAGTVVVKDLNTLGSSDAHGLVVYGKLLYFFAKSDALRGETLYSTDGTAANTKACFTLPTGTTGSAPVVCNGKLFYVTRNSGTPFTSKLWRTNGTAADNKDVRHTIIIDPNMGNTITIPPENAINYAPMVVMNNWLYFGADYDAKGMELWKVQ